MMMPLRVWEYLYERERKCGIDIKLKLGDWSLIIHCSAGDVQRMMRRLYYDKMITAAAALTVPIILG